MKTGNDLIKELCTSLDSIFTNKRQMNQGLTGIRPPSKPLANVRPQPLPSNAQNSSISERFPLAFGGK